MEGNIKYEAKMTVPSFGTTIPREIHSKVVNKKFVLSGIFVWFKTS